MGKKSLIAELGLKLCTGVYPRDKGLKSFQIEEKQTQKCGGT